MGIETKSIGTLFDELVTTLQKCWYAQEDVMKGGTAEQVAAAAHKAQTTNGRRNELIRAIDAYFGDKNAPTSKTYVPEAPDRVQELESVLRELYNASDWPPRGVLETWTRPLWKARHRAEEILGIKTE